MKIVVSILLGAQVVTATVVNGLEPRACAGDNCNRAITGNSLATHLLDCSSYFSTTIIPATSIIVVTVTTVPSPYGPSVASSLGPYTISTAIPSAIPKFAKNACSGNDKPISIRYSSACSCAGVKGTTITAPTPVTTSTIFVSAKPFIVQATASPDPTTYFLNDPGSADFTFQGAHLTGFVTDKSKATTMNLQCNIPTSALEIGDSGFVGSQQGGGYVFFNPVAMIGRYMGVELAWTIDPVDDGLTTSNGRIGGVQGLANCTGTLSLVAFGSGSGSSCNPVSLKVLYI